MRALVMLLLVGWTVGWCSYGQHPQPNSQLLAEHDLSEFPTVEFPRPGQRGGVDTLDFVDLRPYAPIPADQGGTGSCAAHAVCHALTIERAVRSGWRSRPRRIDAERHAVAYLHNQLTADCTDCRCSVRLSAALRLARQRGVCLEQTFPRRELCGPLPNDSHHQAALRYRVDTVRRLWSDNPDRAEKKRRLHHQLRRQHPVILALDLPTAVLSNGMERELITPSAVELTAPERVRHAMVAVGFDAYYERILVMNSYGPEWGKQGFAWLPEALVLEGLLEGFVLEFSAPSPPPAQVRLRYLVGFTGTGTERKMLYHFPAVTYESTLHAHRLLRTDWERNKYFELEIRDLPPEDRVYIYHLAPEGEIQPYYPSVDGTGNRIVRNGEHPLSITTSGDHYFLVLHARKDISEVDHRVKQLFPIDENWMDRLSEQFGAELVSPTVVRYALDRMSYVLDVPLPAEHPAVVSLLLQIQAH